MMKNLPLWEEVLDQTYQTYESKYKALADRQRLKILHELARQGKTCVCDLTEVIGIKQSKLSYHLKILLDAGLITREKIGTWNYYEPNMNEIRHLIPEPLIRTLFESEHEASQ